MNDHQKKLLKSKLLLEAGYSGRGRPRKEIIVQDSQINPERSGGHGEPIKKDPIDIPERTQRLIELGYSGSGRPKKEILDKYNQLYGASSKKKKKEIKPNARGPYHDSTINRYVFNHSLESDVEKMTEEEYIDDLFQRQVYYKDSDEHKIIDINQLYQCPDQSAKKIHLSNTIKELSYNDLKEILRVIKPSGKIKFIDE